jgi:hypothetical protein
MKGHVSYERAPLRGYIYNPQFSVVIYLIISYSYTLFDILSFMDYNLLSYLHWIFT